MNGTTYTYEMENEIRGYHVYGSSWKPKIGDFFLNDRDVSNEDDKFAVAVYDCEISCILMRCQNACTSV